MTHVWQLLTVEHGTSSVQLLLQSLHRPEHLQVVVDDHAHCGQMFGFWSRPLSCCNNHFQDSLVGPCVPSPSKQKQKAKVCRPPARVWSPHSVSSWLLPSTRLLNWDLGRHQQSGPITQLPGQFHITGFRHVPPSALFTVSSLVVSGHQPPLNSRCVDFCCRLGRR